MATQRYFLSVLGTTYAVLNAPVRQGPQDVVCLRGLTSEQQLRYSQMKERGDPEEVVFREEIADLLRSFLGGPVPSLEGANKADLQALCRFLLRPSEAS
jgi:hypothetical protein